MNSKNFSSEIKSCEEYIASKSFKKADISISNAIQINSESPYAWYLKSKVCLGLLDYENALSACENAIELNPKKEYVQLKGRIENFTKLDRDDLTNYYSQKIDNLLVLTNSKNIEVLSQRKLNGIVYQRILDNFKDGIVYKKSDDDIFLKVKMLTENAIDLNFVENHDSSNGIVGAYGFKKAAIDSRLSKTLQIAAMIHEFAHHLLFEIFKNAVMYIYKSQNSEAIEAFGWYCITQNVYWLLMNEYCAHMVECRYVPYNNFESFNKILKINENLNISKVKKAVELGESLSRDIAYILDGFFTDKMKEEIKMQFLSDRVILKRKGCEFKSEGNLSSDEKFDMINSILRENIISIKINFSYRDLIMFKRIFEMSGVENVKTNGICNEFGRPRKI